MKVGNLSNLIVDSQDVVSYFSGVDTQEKMKAALERISTEEPEAFLVSVQGLVQSIGDIVEDDLEVSDLQTQILGSEENGELDNELEAARNSKDEKA